ncbi:hypothetical protein HanRHA438_Chr05g0217621 [Helianthus annuus]|uniref:Uncharacterized protein n=1 Tax=Helianthus annuus TaxID=4232 RepID=A0A251UMZ6_HELAN|nr:hypothetical protein HanXRQr2_Chr05g0208061 [Helianthus annuus]KAJ0576415.1 hypothetical protein HanIR_Chr05g0224181 [Helianthus annuus]KAJ0918408.1 hypothetical protein HanRHA438_Chr05g0217621 [Helianthus annuus]KAJ0922213.1 hypothetical protein HanPSC8_Chr05g0201031 [Helianthus annuus]
MMMTIYAESMVKRTDILGFKYPITFSLLLMLTVLCKEYSLCEKCFSSCKFNCKSWYSEHKSY